MTDDDVSNEQLRLLVQRGNPLAPIARSVLERRGASVTPSVSNADTVASD